MIIKEVRSDEETSGNPRAYTERPPQRCVRTVRLLKTLYWDIYLINQARGSYWENSGPRSWQYGPIAARSVQERPGADILPVRSRGSLVNKRFITRLKLFRRKTQMIDCKDTINFKRAIFYLKQTEHLLKSDVFKNWEEKESWKKTKVTFYVE